MTGSQGQFAGVVKIIRFNSPFYILSFAAVAGACLVVASKRLPLWLELAVLASAAIVTFWTLSSILVSWYIYDHAGVTRWQWLPRRITSPSHWANIHAGLDESTSTLRELFPGTEGCVVDIYDPGTMTEPSIAKARRLYPAREPFRQGNYNLLPLPDTSCDAIFLLFAAHEVRASEQRQCLFSEAARVLKKGGYVVLVEHLRDWKNFLAFGPGCLHFHSRKSWLHTIHNAGFAVEQQNAVTPFVECFVLRRPRR